MVNLFEPSSLHRLVEAAVYGSARSTVVAPSGYHLSPLLVIVGVVVVAGIVLFMVAKDGPYNNLLEWVKSRRSRNFIVALLRVMKRGGEIYVMGSNPFLERDEFDSVFSQYKNNKDLYEAILWRLAHNPATPVDILGQLTGNLETKPEIAVRELLIEHPAASDEVKTMWALQWGLGVPDLRHV